MDLSPSNGESTSIRAMDAIEAIVVILDANYTMSEEFASSGFHDDDSTNDDSDNGYNDAFLGTTKFDAARYAAYDIINQAHHTYDTTWLASVGCTTSDSSPCLPFHQEVLSVIVLRTPGTDHHLHRRTTGPTLVLKTDDNLNHHEETTSPQVDFPNITELSCGDLARKVLEVDVTRIRDTKFLPHQRTEVGTDGIKDAPGGGDDDDDIRGDIVQGIVLATDVLHRRTATTRKEVSPSPQLDGGSNNTTTFNYGQVQQCRIVLLTDAQHQIDVIGQQQRLLVALDALRAMKCRLEVVGMDFDHHGDFPDASSPPSWDPIVSDQSRTDLDSDEEENEDDDDDDEGVDGDLCTKRQNEQFLVSLTSKTGGFVRSAKSTGDVLAAVDHMTHRWQYSTNMKTAGCNSIDVEVLDVEVIDVEVNATLPTTVSSSPLLELQQNVGRQTFSLEPSSGGRMRWNGTDDVSLSEWLQKARPSLIYSEFCSWIQIDNVRRDSPGYEDMDSRSSTRNIDEYMAPLNKIRSLIESGKRISTALKTDCVREIMRIAKRDGNTVGKWLVYCTPDTVDDVWETIARATAMGRLGCSSKIQPAKYMQQNDRAVVCVYVKDCTDQHEVLRVLTTLKDDLGITSGLSGFKPDVYTDLGIYSNNGYRLKPTLYSNAKDVLSWTF